jgi:hypothetical protein
MTRRRPGASEYAPYYERYVGLVPEEDAVAVMREQLRSTPLFLAGVPKEKVASRYAPGKWTVSEVIGHVIDLEWIFTARALHFARAVAGPLPGVEQDDMMKVANFAARPWAETIDAYRLLRAASTALFEGFDEAAWDRTGVASGLTFTTRAIPFIIAGHERHHLRVLRERYLR